MLTYIAPETKAGMAIVNMSIWGDHVYFYGSDEAGGCEMNRVTSFKANKKPQLEYSKLQNGKPVRDHYSSCQIESPFRWEKVPPFDEWRAQGELYNAIENEFDNIREEFASNKRKYNL